MTDPPTLTPAAAYALWAASYPPHAHNPLMQAEERAMLALLPADLRGRAVLDAGCGSGRYLLHALRRNARRVLGVDLSAEMLARARELGVGSWGLGERPTNPQHLTPNSHTMWLLTTSASSATSCGYWPSAAAA